jgi:hypothetical protein
MVARRERFSVIHDPNPNVFSDVAGLRRNLSPSQHANHSRQLAARLTNQKASAVSLFLFCPMLQSIQTNKRESSPSTLLEIPIPLFHLLPAYTAYLYPGKQTTVLMRG